MDIKARVQVDFQLSPDGVHTLASSADVSASSALHKGELVMVTDGDIECVASVEGVEDDTVSLLVDWDSASDVARAARMSNPRPDTVSA